MLHRVRIYVRLSMPSLFPFYLSLQKPVPRGFIADNKRLRRRFSRASRRHFIAEPEKQPKNFTNETPKFIISGSAH